MEYFWDYSFAFGCVSGGQENEYRELVEHFVAWYGNKHLLLKVANMKEMVVNAINILEEEVEGY